MVSPTWASSAARWASSSSTRASISSRTVSGHSVAAGLLLPAPGLRVSLVGSSTAQSMAVRRGRSSPISGSFECSQRLHAEPTPTPCGSCVVTPASGRLMWCSRFWSRSLYGDRATKPGEMDLLVRPRTTTSQARSSATLGLVGQDAAIAPGQETRTATPSTPATLDA